MVDYRNPPSVFSSPEKANGTMDPGLVSHSAIGCEKNEPALQVCCAFCDKWQPNHKIYVEHCCDQHNFEYLSMIRKFSSLQDFEVNIEFDKFVHPVRSIFRSFFNRTVRNALRWSLSGSPK